MDFSSCRGDNAFGPAVQGCRDDFDFTLKFESIFLSILPAAIFIPVFLASAAALISKPRIVGGAVFQWIKIATAAVFAALHLTLLVLTATQHGYFKAFFLAGSALNFIAALCILPVSFLQHARSPRPAVTLAGYFCLTILFDAARVRTLWLLSASQAELSYARLFTAGIVIKVVMLILEGTDKRRWLQWHSKEPHSPEETSSIYDLSAFWWLNRLFRMGYKKVLKMDDLFALDRHLTSETLQPLLAQQIEKIDFNKHPKHGLAMALVRAIAVPLILPVAPRVALVGFTLCQPFLIQSVLDWLQQTSDSADSAESHQNSLGYGLIGATILIYTGVALSTGLYWYYHERALWMTRSALAGVVYRKTTQSGLQAADDSAALTLMSTDVEKIRLGLIFIHEYWANTFQIAIACWLLYRQLGPAFVAPIGVVIFSVALSSFTSRLAGPRQKAWMERIQKRVGLTSNVIQNMKHLKISGLANSVESAVQQMRVDELRVGQRFRMIQLSNALAGFLPTLLAPVITFAAAARWLDVTTIYVAISFLQLLTEPLIFLIQAVPSVAAALACFTRIQTFLMKEQREDVRQSPQGTIDEKTGLVVPSQNNFAIKIVHGTFGWTENKPILKDITMTVPVGQLTIVVGPVASGKSTLCKALLGEISHSQGQILLGSAMLRKIGFCDQTPFLYNKTVRQNILGFADFDQDRYNEVLDATMLLPDLALLPQGDETNIGSNGITLSGGQKQRVSMARALYLTTDMFVFDDILSGLDAETEEHVFRHVFGPQGLIRQRNATAVLCTHAVRRLPSADHIVALSPQGTLVEEGKFEDLVANKQYIHSLDIQAAKGEQSDKSGAEAPTVDTPPSATKEKRREQLKASIVPSKEDNSRQLGDSRVFKHYFSTIKPFWLLLFVLGALSWGSSTSLSTLWLKFWSADAGSPDPAHPYAFYIGIYALFGVVALLGFTVNVLVSYTRMINEAGSKLHKNALHAVIRAPLRFFTVTDVGQVTNLFSQDMSIIDSELMMSLTNVSLDGVQVVASAAVIATASPWIALSYPIIIGFCWALQMFYLRTSRQLRLLDLEAKSPLYTNFMDTLKGLATVRAFGWTEASTKYNDGLLNESQRPAYLLAMIQRWLIFVMNALVGVLAIFVVALATQLRSSAGFTGASLVSLMSMGTMLAFLIRMYTLLETSIGAVARLKTFSEGTKPEDLEGEDLVPGIEWPTKGLIEIKNVSASYGSEGTEDKSVSPDVLALQNLNVSIRPGEKVAICGRTGSGKSSTMLLLLRLLDPLPSYDSSMTIDGISLARIDRSTLRRRIIAVPQDAVFLPDGTSFQTNLDPYESSTAAECQSVLEAVGLWAFVQDRGGLDAGLAGDTLSMGQKQLFSLARAMLRRRLKARALRSPSSHARGVGETDSAAEKGVAHASVDVGGLLLLDEVSSSVDLATEKAMHEVIRSEFSGYTIVMVSHRLDVVMDFDRVIVMDSGGVVESGAPRELAAVEGGRFRDLWLAAGQK